METSEIEFKSMLLKLLREDKEVRNTVQDLVSRAEAEARHMPTDRADNWLAEKEKLENQIVLLREEQVSLKKENTVLRQEKDALSDDKEKLKKQIDDLRLDLQREQAERHNAGAWCSDLQHKLEQKEKKIKEIEDKQKCLQDEMKTVQRELEDTKSSKKRLKATNREMQKEKEKLQQELAQRLPDIWKSWQIYLSLPDKVQDLLQAVWVRGCCFSAFVAGAAQEQALELVWEEAGRCWEQEDSENKEKLWQIFCQLLEFVNQRWENPRYQIIPTYDGKQYDDREHLRKGKDGRAQGAVVEIYLKGYIKSGAVQKKSWVKLG